MFELTDFNSGSRCHFRDFASKGEMEIIYLEFREEHHRIAGYTWQVLQTNRQTELFICRWFGLEKGNDGQGTYVVPFFSFYPTFPYPYASVRVLFEPVNHLDKSNEEFKFMDKFYYKTKNAIRGKKMYLSEILDTKNGWLSEDGTFSYNAAIDIEAVMDTDECWRFNVFNKPFKHDFGPTLVRLFKEGECFEWLCSHVQMYKLHCPRLSELAQNTTFARGPHILGCPCMSHARACLNILHGVQVRLKTGEELFGVLEIAKLYGFQNVIRYCERQLIEDAVAIGNIEDKILLAIQADFNQYLSILLKELEQKNKLLEILEKVDIGMISGDSMKIFVRKLLYSTK
ncbi:unnamed protein product [Caenorhabditis brenneri]